MYGSEAFERVLNGDQRMRSTILGVSRAVETFIMGFRVCLLKRPPKGGPKAIVGRDKRFKWYFGPFFRGFLGYARVLGLQRAASGRFEGAINDLRGILGRWNFFKQFFGNKRV